MRGLSFGTQAASGAGASLPLEITNGPTHAFNANETSPMNVFSALIYSPVATGGTGSYTYSKSGIDSARFTINPTTGDVAYASPGLDYESPSDSDVNGIYLLTITVDDGVDTYSQDLTITVIDAAEFSITMPGTIIVETNGGPYVLNASGVTPQVTYTPGVGSNTLNFTITATSGICSVGETTLTPTNNGTSVVTFSTTYDALSASPGDLGNLEFTPDADYAGSATITLSIVDPSTGQTGSAITSVTVRADTVYLFSFGDLGNFLESDQGAAAIKFSVSNGTQTVGPIYLDSTNGLGGNAANVLTGANELGSRIATALAGISLPVSYSGKVSASVVSDTLPLYEINIILSYLVDPPTLSIVSPRLMPLAVMQEGVDQQGQTAVAGAYEDFTITCTGNPSSTDTIVFAGDGGASVDTSGFITSTAAPSGFTLTGGGDGSGNTATYTSTIEAAYADAAIDSITTDGTYSVTINSQGVDPVSDVQEVHSVTTSPTPATGGTYVLGGVTADYSGTPVDPNPGSTGVWTYTSGNPPGTDGGPLVYTRSDFGDISNTALAPDGAGLTYPQISIAIS